MTAQTIFPDLKDWDATKATLHAYSKVLGVVPRAHAEPHPKWWHISLKVQPDGLVTDQMKLPGGGTFHLKMDLHHHHIALMTNRGEKQYWNMAAGLTATELANQLFEAVASLGLQGEYAREKFENDKPRLYHPAQAEAYFSALKNVDRIFKSHRSTLVGEIGPVQLWPHGFDLAFEWFGTRMLEYEEHGQVSKYPAQLNLGFSPGEPSHPKPYFYSNPFPFEAEKLLHHPLPHGARWFTESWQGTLLEYSSLVDDPQAGQKVLDYAQSVFEICSPYLMG